jgi:hypothetical protein
MLRVTDCIGSRVRLQFAIKSSGCMKLYKDNPNCRHPGQFHRWVDAPGEITMQKVLEANPIAQQTFRIAAKSASPDQAQNADALIKFLRQGAKPPPPIRVEITNAADLAQKDTVLRIERDSSGKLTGAIAHKI